MSTVVETSAAESQLVMLLGRDAIATQHLASSLERERRTVITCNDIESAQLMVERLKPSHVVTDMDIAFALEGLEFVDYARRHSPETRVILVAADAPDALQLEASQRGAVAFLRKPLTGSELASVLDMISCSPLSSAADAMPLIRVPPLDEILTSDALRPYFQPIVSLSDAWKAVGYESLTRFDSDSPLRNPEVLFRYAGRKGRLADLEFVCTRNSLRGARAFGELVFINVHPHALLHGIRLCETFDAALDETGVDPKRVVIEITEHAALRPDRCLFATIEYLRARGIRFAFDDLGVACSHMPLIDKIRPSFLKISQHFGAHFQTDAVKRKLIANLVSIASEFGCSMILEGIETEATARAAAALGIPFGQGFFFGYPADITTFAR